MKNIVLRRGNQGPSGKTVWEAVDGPRCRFSTELHVVAAWALEKAEEQGVQVELEDGVPADALERGERHLKMLRQLYS